MARSTRSSLAGTAAAVAKKVVGRRGAGKAEAPDAATDKTPATKTPTKKTASKKAPAAKKAPAKKAPAAQASAKKPPAKNAAAKKAPAKKAAPATKSTPAAKKTTAAKNAPAKKAPVKKTATAEKPAPATKSPRKTTAGKRATPSRLVVLDGESPWTKAELNEVVADLRADHDRLSDALGVSERELDGLMRDSGDGAGQDPADLGASSFERDHELTVLANEREMLAQTDRALAHIDDGTYGVCDSCGNPVGKNRLMAFPRATLCMSCKQREERR